MKKIIKLINNERINRNVSSAKATLECDATSTDVCAMVNYDNAHCTVGSYDLCVKDYAACSNHSIDYCPGRDDIKGCIAFEATDY